MTKVEVPLCCSPNGFHVPRTHQTEITAVRGYPDLGQRMTRALGYRHSLPRMSHFGSGKLVILPYCPDPNLGVISSSLLSFPTGRKEVTLVF